ncbi:MAG: methylmalonyl Co-A mutase-associated GTPase MeaB [Deltaproteobacteria bacterium]|nr:MAG: methylmalonyl Co-A mutase-associated GTPase MeaB [Deltaproteobacteria bacterium]
MSIADDGASLAEAVLGGSVRHTARLIRGLADGRAGAREALERLFPATGRAWTVGVTGVPGAGKSTLCNALIASWRRRGFRVGVLAIDPSSPFTGGAILGDRVRMQHHAGDEGVFVHSLATRGHLGGLSRATAAAAHVLDAAGYDRVLIETVGVGQDEVDVVRTADTTVVVLVPGLGDEVQSIKAGIMEIADVFCVNKADRPDASLLVRQLRQLAQLGGGRGAAPAVVRSVATVGEGVEELVDRVESLAAAQRGTAAHGVRRAERLRHEVVVEVAGQLRERAEALLGDASLDAVLRRERSPMSLAAELVEGLLGPL